MRNQVVSPRFSEKEYKGQDVVHYGVRIPLKNKSLQELSRSFSRRAQRIIKNADTELEFREMVDGDLSVLREMWFDPKDNTFPMSMDGHMGITSVHKGQIVGGCIWSHAGDSLFLHQLISDERGKRLQVPTLLVWKSTVEYFNKGFFSLDVGVSYNPKRYEFFCNFAAEKYPIILKKPFYVPVIRLSPFRSIQEKLPERSEGRAKRLEESDVTFFPRGSYALYGALKYIGAKEGDNVVIIKTFGSNFISACVTNAIEKTGAEWKLRGEINSETKALLVVHEFGIPVFQDNDIETIKQAKKLGIRIIEDCAWRTNKVIEGAWSILSMQKMFNINYGGLLLGVKLSDDFMWSIGCLDIVKRERFLWEPKFEATYVFDQRIKNWKQYHKLVIEDGMTPDDCYNYESAIDRGEWIPTVYMQKFESDQVANDIVERLEEFGIQAGRYWGESVVYLPIHQNMTSEEIEYMFAVVRGYFNLCRDWGNDTIKEN